MESTGIMVPSPWTELPLGHPPTGAPLPARRPPTVRPWGFSIGHGKNIHRGIRAGRVSMVIQW